MREPAAALAAEDRAEAPARGRPAPRLRLRWRALLRAMHRDMGYLVVGLTFVYAVSGLALNHIEDWDPNFTPVDATHELPAALRDGLPADDAALAAAVLEAAGRSDRVEDVFRIDDRNVDVILAEATLHVDVKRGVIKEEGQRPRFLLRVANWLHANRGKKAWTYVADAYAVLLLVLATSGMFMLAGRKGLLGRGAVLVVLGVAVPIAYVAWSGGP